MKSFCTQFLILEWKKSIVVTIRVKTSTSKAAKAVVEEINASDSVAKIVSSVPGERESSVLFSGMTISVAKVLSRAEHYTSSMDGIEEVIPILMGGTFIALILYCGMSRIKFHQAQVSGFSKRAASLQRGL